MTRETPYEASVPTQRATTSLSFKSHNDSVMLAARELQFAIFEFGRFVPVCRCRDKNRFAWNGESKMPSVVGEDFNINICIP